MNLRVESSKACPSCESQDLWIFYEENTVPVHSVVLLTNKEDAINFPNGDIRLGFCRNCGFITNLAFDSSLQDYTSTYESTQSYSPAFNRFAQELATRLIKQYDLYDKTIIEIGCGQGEFLGLLCKIGNNRGIGFDPAYGAFRSLTRNNKKIEIIKDYYSEDHRQYQADFIICKMTLEHINNTQEFVKSIRRSISQQSDPIIFFQVPDVTRILRENAFWDIYYEHCSYFSPGSLTRLFQRCGFTVIDLRREYGDQYITIEVCIDTVPRPKSTCLVEDLEKFNQKIIQFSNNCKDHIETWRNRLIISQENQQKVVIWGGGSKAVAFLTTINIPGAVTFVVDINPNKENSFMPGHGQKIIQPIFLKEYKPNSIIVMNPVYLLEIQTIINQMNLEVELIAV